MSAIREDLNELKADLRAYIGERCDRIEARLEDQNGRLRTAEKCIAVLKDRGGRPGAVGAATGGGAGLLLVMAWEWLRAKLQSP